MLSRPFALAAIALAAIALGTAPLAAAQDTTLRPPQPRYVYESVYQINFADIPEWNRIYRKYAVPVLRQMVAEGVLTDWWAGDHHTGGRYNWRFVWYTHDWPSIDNALEQYFSRFGAASPAGTPERVQRLVFAHSDEILEIGSRQLPPGVRSSFLYTASYHINFADLPEWNDIHDRVVVPVLQDLKAEGLLVGWATLLHEAGGDFNWRLLYYFDSWDAIDDFFKEFGARQEAADPEAYTRRLRLIQSHHDYIWEPVRLDPSDT